MRFYASVVLALVAALATACGGDDEASADASTVPDASPPRGTISLTWSITQGGGDATCGDVSGQFVVLDLIRQGEGAGESDPINCTAGEGTTHEVGVGIYNIDIDLVDSSANSLLDAPIEIDDVEVTDGDDSAIGEIVFEL